MSRRSTNDARPRVLMLTTTFPAQPGDGTPEFVLSLAQALSTDHDVTVLTPRVRGAALDQTIGSVRVKRFRYFLRRWERLADGAILPNLRNSPLLAFQIPTLMIAFSWSSYRIMRRDRSDLVHAHWLFPAGFVAWLSTRLVKLPYVVTAHGADGYALRGRVFGLIKRTVMRGAHAVSPVSRELGERLGMDKETVDRFLAPMGVDAAEIAASVGRPSPLHGRFLFVGRLESKKGTDVLLHALHQVPNAELIVIGDGSERNALHDLRESLGVADRVTFLGRQPRARVLEELRSAYALVVPSRVGKGGDTDGTPVVLGEAMAAGVPVIASRIGGLEDQIENDVNGLLVEPASVESLRDGLVKAIASPDDVSRWARVAIKTVESSLDIRVTAATYERIYSDAMTRSR